MKINLLILALICFVGLTGCGTVESFSETMKYKGSKSTFWRKLTPRPMRQQIFDNVPTHYNQDIYSNQPRRKPEGRDFFSGHDAEEFLEDEELLAHKGYQGGDSYGQGFQDGCDTHVSNMGPGGYRMVKPKINAHRLTTDAWYLRGFQDGGTFCTFRVDWEVH